MLTPSLEDYLEELYALSITGALGRPKDLSDRLSVSMPSVTKALQRLDNLGYIVYEAYGNIRLTDKGTEVGRYLFQRNKILKKFLTLLDIDCDIDAEVESMEHYISPVVLLGIKNLIKEEIDSDLSLQTMKELDTLKQIRRFGGKRTKLTS